VEIIYYSTCFFVGNVLKNSWWFLANKFVYTPVNLKRKQALMEINLPAIRLMHVQ